MGFNGFYGLSFTLTHIFSKITKPGQFKKLIELLCMFYFLFKKPISESAKVTLPN